MKIEERIKMEDIPTLNLISSELDEMIKEVEKNEDIEDIFNNRIDFKFANDFIYFAKIPHTIGGLTVLKEKIMNYVGDKMNKLEKAKKVVLEDAKKEGLEFIGDYYEDDSITLTFTSNNLEHDTEMVLFHLDMMLEQSIIFSHAYKEDNIEITIKLKKDDKMKIEYEIEDYSGNTIGIITDNNGKIDVDGEIDIADIENERYRIQINNPIFTYKKINKETILEDLLSIEYEYGFFDGKWDSNEYDREEPSIHYYDEMCKYATKYQITIPSKESVLDEGDTVEDIEDWVIQERIATILKDTLREKLKKELL